jgi:hypothetical protein
MARITRGAPPRLSEVAPDLPPQLDAFFARAFAPAERDRFGSAREMAAVFAALVATLPAATTDWHAAHVPAAPASVPAPALYEGGRTLTQLYRPIDPVPARQRRIGVAVVAGAVTALLVLGTLVAARDRAASLEGTETSAASLAAANASAAPAAAEAIPPNALAAPSPGPEAAQSGDRPVAAARPPEDAAEPAGRGAAAPERGSSSRPKGAAERAAMPATAAPGTPRSRQGEERLPVVY